MGSKRLTYLTSDGKRHWVKIQKYRMPEGVGFEPACEGSACRSHTELRFPKDKRRAVSRETVLDQSHLASDKRGT